jgi:hypothetical protein
MELKERVYQEIRLILSTGASDLFEEGERLTEEAIGDVTQSMQAAPTNQVAPAPAPVAPGQPPVPVAPAPSQPPVPVASAPGQMTAADVERQRVQNQLAGLPA